MKFLERIELSLKLEIIRQQQKNVLKQATRMGIRSEVVEAFSKNPKIKALTEDLVEACKNKDVEGVKTVYDKQKELSLAELFGLEFADLEGVIEIGKEELEKMK